MSAAKYLKILRKIKDVAFATVDEEGKSQVRIIDIMIAEGEKLYFCDHCNDKGLSYDPLRRKSKKSIPEVAGACFSRKSFDERSLSW